MSLAESPSSKSVPELMMAKRLTHALSTWLEDQDPSAPPCDPHRLHRVTQQTIEELGTDASHDSLLKQAKKNWNDMGPPSESETLGQLIREWLIQQGHEPAEHHRAIAGLFAEVQRAMPDANQERKLHAIKGLWTACYQGTTAERTS